MLPLLFVISLSHAVLNSGDVEIEKPYVAAQPNCAQAPDQVVYIAISTPDQGDQTMGAQGLVEASQGAQDMCKLSYERALACQNNLSAVKVGAVGPSTGYRGTTSAGSASVNAAMKQLEAVWNKCDFDQAWGRRYCFQAAEASNKALNEYKESLRDGLCEITTKRAAKATANLSSAIKYLDNSKSLWRQLEQRYNSSHAALVQAGAAIVPIERAVSSDDDGVI